MRNWPIDMLREALGLNYLIRLLERLESRMAITQQDLDNLAHTLTDSNERIGQELRKLREENPNLDLSGLSGAVAAAAELVPSAVTPGVPPVAADPSTPVVVDPESGDAGGETVELPADGSTPQL